MIKIILSLICLFSFSAMAQKKSVPKKETKTKIETKTETVKEVPKEKEPEKETILEKAGDTAEAVVKDVSASLKETRERRANNNYFATFNYSSLDLIIPGKIGGTVGLISNADKTWELEYLVGTVKVPFLVKDLGKMSDEKISLIGRSYVGSNSFNFNYGLTYFDFTMHLGDAVLSRMSSGNYPSVDLVEMESLGFNVGIGNRWIFNKNITFGVDWITWSQPVFTLKRKSLFLDYASNQEDRDNVDKAMRIIAYFPRLTLLKAQLGITF